MPLSGFVRCQRDNSPDRRPPLPDSCPVLENVCFGAPRSNSQAKAGEFAVPNEDVILGIGLSRIDNTFCKSEHNTAPVNQGTIWEAAGSNLGITRTSSEKPHPTRYA